MIKKSIAEQFDDYHNQLYKILDLSCRVPFTPLARLSGIAAGIAASLRDREDSKTGVQLALDHSKIARVEQTQQKLLKSMATPLDVMKILDSSFVQNEIQRASVDYYIVGPRLYRLFDPGMAGGQFEYLSRDRKRWLKSEHGQYRYKFLAAKADRARKITAEQAERFKAGEGQAVAPYPHLYTSGDRLYWVSSKGSPVKLFVPALTNEPNHGTWIIARTTETKLLKRHGRGKVTHWPTSSLQNLQQVRRMQWTESSLRPATVQEIAYLSQKS